MKEHAELRHNMANRRNYELAMMVRDQIWSKHPQSFETFYPQRNVIGGNKDALASKYEMLAIMRYAHDEYNMPRSRSYIEQLNKEISELERG